MAPVHAAAQSATFVAPPRTIADITAILDQEKPDPAAARKLRAAAEAVPPVGASRPTLAKFHFDRSEARVRLGDYRGALADAQLALDIGEGAVTPREIEGIRRHVALIYLSMGDPKNALEVFLSIAQTAKGPELKGFLFNTYRHITGLYSLFGRFDEAEAYLRKAEALLEEARSWPSYRGYFRLIWEGEVETARAGFYEARGQFAQAESALRQAESLRREAVLLPEWPPTVPPRYIIERVADIMLAALGRVKAQQGRMAEGEADVRRALLNQLKTFGKYNLLTQKLIWIFANLLLEQGRYIEAEKLTRTQIEVLQALGIPSDSQQLAKMWNALAANLTLQERWQDAAQVYAELDAATRLWEPERKSSLNLSTARIDAFYNTGDLSAGIAMAERLLLQQASLFGEQHLETALARGMLAVGLARAGRDADAWREFRAAVPVLISASRGIDLDDSTDIVARERRIQMVVESYMELLARGGAPDAAGDSFRLADAIRGRAVQAALNASSMRWAAKNPATAELIRRSQDLEKQIGARLGLLNNLLALPSEQRDDNAVNALQGEIESMRSAREAADREIAAKFPDYLNLMASQAPDAKDIQNVLGADEAFLSIYLGRDASFVWAIAKTGPSAFISVPVGRSEIDRKVLKLREALEPTGVTVGEIPAFDLALAHEIYSLLLKPVELTWGAAKNLIVVTNGALGLLPLGLLPTAPATVASDAAPLFAGYRSVPWLARTHAVSMVPSAGALTTLRRLPPGAPSREQLIGFGDPFFSAEEASQAQAGQAPKPVEVAARGLPLKRRAKVRTSEVDSAELAALPRLPDTADELKSIALALQADPTKVVHLGRDANERTIKTSALERYRVVAFATHGLVPGDLNGLTQPALALTAPEIADVDGDGLLTMDEILGLKLDADWVVLSACNTGAGAAAGAEAASGLGRAFFYAGARALLVTNWSVYSDAARALVSDLFRRQTAEAQLSRGEALRQAMMALLDGPGYTDASGKTLFTYGHPIFWAPYTLIGDNGR
jgi:CHAT domain-containing protein/tetratricopeptide (TPR) repeat protein